MEKMKVRELMRPIDEFPRISSRATFMEAVESLDSADLAFRAGKAPERIVLVSDERGRIIGKLSPIDVVKALEPNFSYINDLKIGFHKHLVQASLDSMKELYRVWHNPLLDLWQKATSIRIRDFINRPQPDQMVHADDTMDTAFHRFVEGRHGSLFVRDGGEIVGLIRFSDVYRKIKEAMRLAPVGEATAETV
ncbi:CBS domain-containing protein [Desulfatitalea tepidiphila]|uniref:CBS domain-containing protein n=1 Tax=Desulfatitalea tepidiphila TaxID=1185843 RepID=UPI0006B4FFBD|nr:CBS domain-containing protein [Desulfatitalea tepidiphila]